MPRATALPAISNENPEGQALFSIHIDGLDGSLEWGKPTLAEAIAIASGELKERRFPVHATIIDSAKHQMVWEGTKSASGVITSTNVK